MIDEGIRSDVFDKTRGRCYYCDKALSFYNRDRRGRGAWEVEHLTPRAKGGTDHLNNLVAACWPCNLEKGTRASRSHRQKMVPVLSARTSRRRWRIADGALLLGLIVAGVVGAVMMSKVPEQEAQGRLLEDERKRFFWKMILIPAFACLAIVVLVVVVREMSRNA